MFETKSKYDKSNNIESKEIIKHVEKMYGYQSKKQEKKTKKVKNKISIK